MCNKEGLININVSWEDGNGWDPKTMFHGWSLISKYRWVKISVYLHVYCWEFRKTQFCWLLFTLWNKQWGRSAAESDRGSGPLVKVFSAYAHSTVWSPCFEFCQLLCRGSLYDIILTACLILAWFSGSFIHASLTSVTEEGNSWTGMLAPQYIIESVPIVGVLRAYET